MRRLLLVVGCLCCARAAQADPMFPFALPTAFHFAMPTIITAVVDDPLDLPAIFVNLTATPIDFGCAVPWCGGPTFGAGLGNAEGSGDFGLLGFSFGFGGDFYSQFAGHVLAPGAMLPFQFGSITLAPMPIGTVALLNAFFRFDGQVAVLPLRVTAGDVAFLSPFIVPEPASLLLLGSGLLVALRRRQ